MRKIGLMVLATASTVLLLLVGVLATACRPGPTEAPEVSETRVLDQQVPVPEPLDLAVGEALTRELAPGETDVFVFELVADRFLHLVVEQRGVDVAAVVLDPGGQRVVASDRPNSYQGSEELLALTEGAGAYRLEVAAFATERPPGAYEIRLEARRPASAEDRLRAQAAGLLSRGKDLRRSEPQVAIETYQRAFALWRQIGDPVWQGEVLFRIAQAKESLRDRAEAEDFYQQANVAFRQAEHLRWQVVTNNALGRSHVTAGEVDLALARYHHALRLAIQADYRQGQANANDGLGRCYKLTGAPQKALDSYQRALDLYDEDMDLNLRARVLQSQGVLYRILGRWDPARSRLEAAVRAFGRDGDHRRRAGPLNQLGQLQQDQGDYQAALATYQQVLGLRRQTGDHRGEAVTLGKIGRVYQALDQLEAAERHYQMAFSLLEDMEQPRITARVLLYRGTLLERLGRANEALESLELALELFEAVSEQDGEAETLLALARGERSRGNRSGALEFVDRALAMVERVRPRPVRQDLRIAFFATVQHMYDFYVDLLMELHRSAPTEGWDGAALEASERGRARALMDLLSEASGERQVGVDAGLIERERRVQAQLSHTEQRRVQLLERTSATADRVAALGDEVRAQIEELEAVRGEIRRQRLAGGSWTEPRPLRLAEMQRQVLGEDDLLLEYKLGEERSFLWAVTRDARSSFELPAREGIEHLVSEAHALMPQVLRQDAAGRIQDVLSSLSRKLLAPAREMLDGKRLLIVPDEALWYLSFAALPDPEALDRGVSSPLIAGHEITYLPSVSTLAVLRREHKSHRDPAFTLAVMADPIFSASDERLSKESGFGAPHIDVSRSAIETETTSFKRLPHSYQEALDIVAVAGAGRSVWGFGFEANKEAVLSGELARYRLVHLATHGHLDTTTPELSGLVFSQLNAAGESVDGTLRAHEISGLQLSAELVVLSACQTALGKQVRGEGILGLTRAFFSAGAQRVVVSLWSVADASTAELMTRFYRYLLEDRLSPSAALRQAQLSLRGEERWSEPYHWAGFVIQGEPR